MSIFYVLYPILVLILCILILWYWLLNTDYWLLDYWFWCLALLILLIMLFPAYLLYLYLANNRTGHIGGCDVCRFRHQRPRSSQLDGQASWRGKTSLLLSQHYQNQRHEAASGSKMWAALDWKGSWSVPSHIQLQNKWANLVKIINNLIILIADMIHILLSNAYVIRPTHTPIHTRTYTSRIGTSRIATNWLMLPLPCTHTHTHFPLNNAPPSASTVHTDRDEPAGRPEDLLLPPLPDRPLPGQARLRQRRRRGEHLPDEGLRPHLPQLGGPLHPEVHVRRQHGVRQRDRRQQHLLPTGIVSETISNPSDDHRPIYNLVTFPAMPPATSLDAPAAVASRISTMLDAGAGRASTVARLIWSATRSKKPPATHDWTLSL